MHALWAISMVDDCSVPKKFDILCYIDWVPQRKYTEYKMYSVKSGINQMRSLRCGKDCTVEIQHTQIPWGT